MKICLVSSYGGRLNEGMANVAFHLDSILSQKHDVLHLKITSGVLSPGSFRNTGRFRPDIIHIVPGPSIRGLMLLRFLNFCAPRARTVVSATQPRFSSLTRRMIRFFKPNIVLCQSEKSAGMFRSSGCKVDFLDNGVDTSTFMPASCDLKVDLRKKFGLPLDYRIALHVGPISRERNLHILARLNRKADTQVLVVGSNYQKANAAILGELTAAGCIVWQDYVQNIEQVYALSDCLVFPTRDSFGCIETPLSVLEAMSCNLEVFSTRYGALPRMFSEGGGFRYFESEDDLVKIFERHDTASEIMTRQKVLAMCWKNVVADLEKIYDRILGK